VSDLETRLDAALREGDRLDAKNVTSIYRCGRCRETGAACKRELAAERRRTNALIASLTECEECGEPAEGLNEGDCSNVCAKHAKADYIEDPWAKPLRAIRTARKRAPR
jgi:hypothetical protein